MTEQKLIYLTSNETRILPADQLLVLSLEDHIVLLFLPDGGQILALGQFPPAAFRSLILLLKSPHGASYAEFLASLHCPYSIIKQILQSHAADDVPEFQVHVSHWQQHLEKAAEKGADALEKELKQVRWAVKERRGVQPIIRKKGFGWRVKVLPRKGYILLRALVSEQKPPIPSVSQTETKTGTH